MAQSVLENDILFTGQNVEGYTASQAGRALFAAGMFAFYEL